MILALDTVFEQCSVALLDKQTIIDERTQKGNRGQTETILPMIDELFKKNNTSFHDIQLLAFNRGPGAFSGIRINTAVVQALSFAHDIPCVGVSSLKALAQKAFIDEGLDHVYAVLDARMNEVYFAEFKTNSNIMQLVNDEKLLPYQSISHCNIHIIGKDAHLAVAPQLANQLCWEIENPTASDIGKIAYLDYLKNSGVTAENALPVYLRHNAWKTLAEQGKK